MSLKAYGSLDQEGLPSPANLGDGEHRKARWQSERPRLVLEGRGSEVRPFADPLSPWLGGVSPSSLRKCCVGGCTQREAGRQVSEGAGGSFLLCSPGLWETGK